MTHAEFVRVLELGRILPAAVIEDPSHAVPIARALVAGGLNLMEVTFRNAHGAESIRRIRAEVPAMRIGAGTLLSAAQVDLARDAGAEFGVTPGFNPVVVRQAVDNEFPLAPGVLTPGEMEQSLHLGCSVVKFFPAAATGGAEFIKAIAAPYAHTSLRLIPFGGITTANLRTFLELPLVIAVGGSWLTDRKLALRGAWNDITELTRQALEQTPR